MGKVRILARDDRPFHNRIEAGRCLGDALQYLSKQEIIVLGIPRGGVVVANEIARGLGAEMDIVLTRKLGAPGNPELAIGAVSETGELILDKHLAAIVGADEEYIKQEKERQSAEIERLVRSYRVRKAKVKLQGKVVVLVDDGVATGSTMIAAIQAVRHEKPSMLIVGLPVGPESAIRRLANLADEVLCVRVPPYFSAVGQFYEVFGQTSDEEVLKILG
ncbi:MAG: phosphoribosyltransferase [Candidatus Omnitrophica bacterium]|nr:phosphoribosyltransferase [Candidatus Omnitrophota bacterium]